MHARFGKGALGILLAKAGKAPSAHLTKIHASYMRRLLLRYARSPCIGRAKSYEPECHIENTPRTHQARRQVVRRPPASRSARNLAQCSCIVRQSKSRFGTMALVRTRGSVSVTARCWLSGKHQQELSAARRYWLPTERDIRHGFGGSPRGARRAGARETGRVGRLICIGSRHAPRTIAPW